MIGIFTLIAGSNDLMTKLLFILLALIISSFSYSISLSDIDEIINDKLDKSLTYVWYDSNFYSYVDYPYNYLKYKVYHQDGWRIDILSQRPKDLYGNRDWYTYSESFLKFLMGSAKQDCLIEIITDDKYVKYDTEITSIEMKEIDKGIYDLSSNCKHQSLGVIVEENILNNKFKPDYPADISIENIKFSIDNGERGSGAAPLTFSNHVSLPDEIVQLDFDIINRGKGNANLTKVAIYDCDFAIRWVVYDEYIISLPGNGAKYHVSAPISVKHSEIKNNSFNLYIHAFEYNGFNAEYKNINIKYKL